MSLTTPEQYRFHQLKRNEIKTLASAIKDCREQAHAFIESRWGKTLMRRRAKVLARESRAVRRFEAGAKKRKGKKIKYELKNERNLKKRLDRLENKNKKYRQGLLKEQNNLMEERDQVFGQAKQELEERLEMIELQLDKDNCLENSDGEDFDTLTEEWTEMTADKEEKNLENDIDELEELNEEEEIEQKQQLSYNRMTWRELLKATRVVAEKEYMEEQCGVVRENIRNQFLLLQRVMKSWLSQAVKACYIAWRDWAKKTARSKKDAKSSDIKARELKEQQAANQDKLEQMESVKWIENFDEFTERIFFEHTETGEIAWDEKPKRGFVLR